MVISKVISCYTDGGVIGPNPSTHGVTWAYCWVAACGERVLYRASGAVTPDDFGVTPLTNNHSELYAAVRCLEALGVGWRGVLWTDSSITLNRLTRREPKFKNVPDWLIERVMAVRKSMRCKVKLTAGHPTDAEINRGKRLRNGLPTSIHNVWCDRACTQAAERFREGVK